MTEKKDKNIIMQKQKNHQQRENNEKSIRIKQQDYNNLSKQELVREILKRDRTIKQVEEDIKKKEIAVEEKINKYRAKLEQQIAQNQKAVKAFADITESILNIIGKFQKSKQFLQQNSMCNDKIISKPLRNQGRYQNAFQQSQNQSQFNCFDQIVVETQKSLQNLRKFVQKNLAMIGRLIKQINQIKLKQKSKDENKDEMIQPTQKLTQNSSFMQTQINSAILQNKNLQKLLLQNQQEKNKLLMSIATALDQRSLQQLFKLSKDQLINHVRKMTYRIKQLQKDKAQIYSKAKALSQANHQKFQDLLAQIKKVKTKKRLSIQINA